MAHLDCHIDFHKQYDCDADADEDAAFNPQVPRQENEPEKDRLKRHESSQAPDEPNL